MNKIKCPVCHSLHTVKNGKRKNIQTYKCTECGYQFRSERLPSDAQLWCLYQERKQTIVELSLTYHVSPSTIKRRLQNVSLEWQQPPLQGGGYVHLDATYWGHNWGVMLALDDTTGSPLYVSFIKNETIADYRAAISSIEQRGYHIHGLIIDGKKSLFVLFKEYRIQMCQFHMIQIVKRYLTKNPRLIASRELKDLMANLTTLSKEEFEKMYYNWKEKWQYTLQKRSHLKNGTAPFRHRRLRSSMHSIDFYLPYLFTFQECPGMPNTNNKIEGTFTDLKKNLNNHSGMTEASRKRFINGFFLALADNLSI